MKSWHPGSPRPVRYGIGFVACCVLSLSAALAATQVVSPDSGNSPPEITVDTATLDRYVGTYQGVSQVQLALPIYAGTPTKFFMKVVDATLSFTVPDIGPPTVVVLLKTVATFFGVASMTRPPKP